MAKHKPGKVQQSTRRHSFKTPPTPQVVDQALIAFRSRDWATADRLCRLVLTEHPDHFAALSLLGVMAAHSRRPDEAATLFRRAIASNPQNANGHIYLGNALRGLRRFEEALASYDCATSLDPKLAEAHNGRGNVLQDLERWAEALESYDRAIALKPDFAAAYNSRGHALREMRRLAEAIASYDRAIALDSRFAEAYSNRGNALQQLKRAREALANFDQALAINPAYAEAYANRAGALHALRRLREALMSCDRAVQLKPHLAEAHMNRGDAFQSLRQLSEAIESYDRAIALNPRYVAAYVNRGAALQELKRRDDARENYRRAMALDPDHEYLAGAWIANNMSLNDWTDFDRDVSSIAAGVSAGRKLAQPFHMLSLTDCLHIQRKTAEVWVEAQYPMQESPALQVIEPGARIRVGYFSADFREHPVAFLTAGLFEAHDRTRFELTAFSLGPATTDGMRARIAAAFEHFIDAREQADEDVARLARSRNIDIAIDLGGHTQDCRTGIFACKAAPLQVNYLGYPGTMAADYIDYLIADAVLIPETQRHHYTEKIAYLPSYQPNDRSRGIADKPLRRRDFGLPDSGFVFCCFNNNYKITPRMFDCWMRILRRVSESVLWVSEVPASAVNNLRKEAALRGVAPERLVFAQFMPSIDEHLARHRLADLFIDTAPYNAHATASNALWAGLPVLTCAGNSFASRVAASLLTAIDLPELITHRLEDYEALAIELATRPTRLAAIKQKLAANRLTSPLFDTQMYARHLEQAYVRMYERYRAGLPAADFHVRPVEPADQQ